MTIWLVAVLQTAVFPFHQVLMEPSERFERSPSCLQNKPSS